MHNHAQLLCTHTHRHTGAQLKDTGTPLSFLHPTISQAQNDRTGTGTCTLQTQDNRQALQVKTHMHSSSTNSFRNNKKKFLNNNSNSSSSSSNSSSSSSSSSSSMLGTAAQGLCPGLVADTSCPAVLFITRAHLLIRVDAKAVCLCQGLHQLLCDLQSSHGRRAVSF